MVKTILKRNNILLSQFASDLNISRPTLDGYIKNFDNGKVISNPLYQKIFEFLFSSITISNEEFKQKYNHVVKNFNNNAVTNLYMSSIENIVSNGSIKNYLTLDECNALGDLVSEKDSLLLHLLKVNLILSDELVLERLTEKEKMLTVGLFELSNKLAVGDFSYSYDSYLKLKNAVVKKSNIVSKEELKKEIFLKLATAINKAVDEGDSQDLTDLLNSISKK